MQYKKSTSTIGFKSRSTPNEAKNLASKAKALDKKRKEEVKEYNAASSSQLKELGRLDGLRTNIDNYEISTQKEFNKAFNGLIATATEDVAPLYIKAKNQDGIDLHRRYEAGDEEAIAIIDGNEKQLAEIEEKLAELQKAAEAKGQELDAAQLEEERTSYENKLRALNIRKLGSNVAYGFSKASLIEGAEGFMPWFMDATRTRKDQIPGEEFTVADYDKLTNSVQRDAVEDFLLNEYIEKVNGNIGAADKVVQSYLTDSVVKQINRWKSSKLADEEANFASSQLEGYGTSISVEASKFTADDNKDVEASKLKLTTSIETYLSLAPSAHFRAGTSGSSNAATKKGIIDIVESIFENTDDSNDIEDLKEFFTTTEFKINNLGTKTLGNHYPFDFKIDDIVGKIAEEKAGKKQSEQLKLKVEYNSEAHELKKLLALGPLDGGITRNEFEIRADAMVDKYSGWYEFDAKIPDLRGYNPSYKTPTKSHQIAAESIKKDGVLTLEEYLELHPSVRGDYQSKVDFDDFVNTTASRDLLESYKSDIEDALDKVYVADSVNPSIRGKDVILKKVKTYALNSIASTAVLLKKQSNEDKPLAEFYEEAYKIVLQDIGNARNDKAGSTYLIDGKDNFNSALVKKLNVIPEISATDFNTKIQVTETRLTEAFKTITTTNGDAFSMEGVKLFGNMDKKKAEEFFQPRKDANGKITGLRTDFIEIMAYDPYNRDEYTLFNLARKSYGLDEIDFDEELKAEDRFMQLKLQELSPNIRALFKRGDMKSMARGFDKIDIVHLSPLTDAIVSHIPIEEVVITPSVLTEILQRPKVNITLEDYNNSIESRNQIIKIRVNDLLKEADQISDNKHVTIRMVAAAITGDELSSWTEGKHDLSGTRVLNTYLGGNIEGGDVEDTVDITNYNKLILSGKEIQALKTPVNIQELGNQINTLNNEQPPKFIPKYYKNVNGRLVEVEEGTEGAFPAQVPGMVKFNDEWAIHKEKTDKLLAQKRVIDNLKQSNILWGINQRNDAFSNQLMYDIKTVIGDERYNALQQKVDSMNLGYKSNEKATEGFIARYKEGTAPYAQEFLTLLLNEDEFFIGEEDG